MKNGKILMQFIMVLTIILFAFFLLIKFNVISFSSTNIIDGILLNKHNIGLKVGSNYQLLLDIYGNYNKKDILWVSSDESIATVSANGKVTAHKKGEVIITSSVLNNQYSDYCKIIVSDEDILIDDLNINASKINMSIGANYRLVYDVYPYSANFNNIDFISSDNNVIEVNDDGVITAKRVGQAIIYITANNGKIADDVLVQVFNRKDSKLPIKDTLDITPGGSYSFYLFSSNNKLTWSSIDENIASVDQNGIIYGKKVGNTKILVSTLKGDAKLIDINVTNDLVPVNNVSLDNVLMSMELGQEYYVNAIIEPSNATNQSLKWNSSNSKVISVNEYGKITAVGEGKSTLTVSSVDGNYHDEVTISVYKPKNMIMPTDIVVPVDELHLYINETSSIPLNISPSNTNFKSWSCSSNNSKIAKCENGLIRAYSKGEAVITFSSANNIKKDIKVTVDEILVTGISLNKYSVSLKINDTVRIVSNVVPKNASFKDITWTSSDPSVVNVSNDGIIKALSSGKALVTAINTNSGKEANVMVSVE